MSSQYSASPSKKRIVAKPKDSQKTAKGPFIEMGEQSKRILGKLLPLIQFCKDRDKVPKPSAGSSVGHKKSWSIAPGGFVAPVVDSTVTLDADREILKSATDSKKGNVNKTLISSHQKSIMPVRPVVKMDVQNINNLSVKYESVRVPHPVKLQLKGVVKPMVEPASQKPMHIRTQSDGNKVALVHAAPKEEIGSEASSKDHSRIITAKSIIPSKPREEAPTKKRPIFISSKQPKKDADTEPILLSEQTRKNAPAPATADDSSSGAHRRCASDGNSIKIAVKGNAMINKYGSVSKPQSQQKDSSSTSITTSKALDSSKVISTSLVKEKIPMQYFSARPLKSSKRSISNAKAAISNQVSESSDAKSSHERSISTQININTYMQENGPSKVISITQDTEIEPFAKDSIDVDIVNIAIKRKAQPLTSSVKSKVHHTEGSEDSGTKYKRYQRLSKGEVMPSNNKIRENEIIKVGKNYFNKPADNMTEKYSTNQVTESNSKEIIEKSYKSNTAAHESAKVVSTPLHALREKAKVAASQKTPILNKSVAIKKMVQEKLLSQKPKDIRVKVEKSVVPLTSGNLAKMEYGKEVVELSKYIKEYFVQHGEAPPTTAEFYRIGKLLGKGAFGKVNLGMHKLTGKMVAIKSINKEYLTDESSKKKVMQEYSILKQMRHPSVIRLYETFESSKHILFVIELCCGGDLLTYVRKRRKLNEETARTIFHHLTQGLHYCHQKGILHRDIKLDNILLNASGHIKICDFGVSKAVKPGERLTEQCGTPAYIAPEILRDKGYEGFGVDIWSAGVVLYAMLYGTVPFKANNMKELHKLITKGKYSLKEGITEEAKNLLRRMLECDPRKRITIPDLYKHKWMYTEEAHTEIAIFTEEEIQNVKKEYEYTRKGEASENRTLFTEQNIDSTVNDLTKNITTKSIILAPFNSTKSNLSGTSSSVEELLKDKKEMIKFAAKVRDIDRQYEKNNNAEIDNGVYNKLVCASSSRSNNEDSDSDLSMEAELEPHNSSANMNSLISEEESKNLPRDGQLSAKAGVRRSFEEFRTTKEELIIGNFLHESVLMLKTIDNDILGRMEKFGYPKEYVMKCLKGHELNYATTTYYLLIEKD